MNKPFWNNKIQNKSNKLWLPKENSINYPINSLCSIEHISNNDVNKTSNNFTNKTSTIFRSKKIRIYPNEKQKTIFNSWFHTSRYVYNKTIKYTNDINNKEDILDSYKLRNLFVTYKNNPTIKDWEIETPKEVRNGIIRKIVSNYKTNFTNLKNGNIKYFEIKYKKRKINPVRTINIDKDSIKLIDNKFQIYKSYNIGLVKKSKEIISDIKYNCQLTCTKENEWYLIIPYKVNKKKITNKGKGKKKRICSLDPGIRKFQTLFSESEVKKYRINKDLTNKLSEKISHLQKLRSDKKIPKRIYLKNLHNIWKRYKNLVSDMQYNICNYLVKNYETIYLPSFESQEMVNNIYDKKTKSLLLNLNHYNFKIYLSHKCEEYDVDLQICNESYTSQTCTKCGNIYKSSSELYDCENCNLIIDRDINGSRNIYLKHV